MTENCGSGDNAAAREIEITSEMIDAGACELAGFNPDFESYEDAAINIYKRMVKAKRRCQISLDQA